MMMNGEVLAELEGLESIDNDFMNRWAVFHHLVVEEQTMPAQTGYVAVDCLGRHFQIAGNLSIGHSSGGFHDDLGIQVGSLLPVGCGKCLGTEASLTGFTCEPLDTVWGGKSSEEADLLERPWVL